MLSQADRRFLATKILSCLLKKRVHDCLWIQSFYPVLVQKTLFMTLSQIMFQDIFAKKSTKK